MPPLTTALAHAQPDTAETGSIAAWAIRRLGDALHDSPTPAASARALTAVETSLYEIEEALRLAAESAAGHDDSTPVVDQLSSAALTVVRLRTQVEAAAVRLRGSAPVPAPATRAERRRAAAAASAYAAATVKPSPATATAFELAANAGFVARSLR
ncbi:hypothetical protein [Kitasatospora phosalacinea]|uniref:Uncharacterized protein n=1 Tax=Kitasatospora phosalacinea TaxID=2065 RepID=A0A9W6PKW9_9ACTN|nr:hypothetical protein [Kitasatospora phosalacinea]GLW58175.1 hypothetical protein Kpho01_61860 [Kitasatospora phosalacinea]